MSEPHDRGTEQAEPDHWQDMAHVLSNREIPDWLRGAHTTPAVFAPEPEVRKLLGTTQARMEAQDPSHRWPDISGLPEHKARRLLVQLLTLASLNHSQDTPTWWTALAARAARRALEPDWPVWIVTDSGPAMAQQLDHDKVQPASETLVASMRMRLRLTSARRWAT